MFWVALFSTTDKPCKQDLLKQKKTGSFLKIFFSLTSKLSLNFAITFLICFSLAHTIQRILLFLSRIFQKCIKILKGSKNTEGEIMPKRSTKNGEGKLKNLLKGSKKMVKESKTLVKESKGLVKESEKLVKGSKKMVKGSKKR